jgi:hypothetical protein
VTSSRRGTGAEGNASRVIGAKRTETRGGLRAKFCRSEPSRMTTTRDQGSRQSGSAVDLVRLSVEDRANLRGPSNVAKSTVLRLKNIEFSIL